jgi:hypothetical protein
MSPLFGNDGFFEEQVRRHSRDGSNSFVHVLLHSTNADHDPNDNPEQSHDPFQLTQRMWICRLPDNLRDIVYQACEPPGVPYEKAFRQYGQLYTIALFTGPWMAGDLPGWDSAGEITQFVTFSQLVHPTSIGFGNSARLTFGPDGSFLRADPGPCRGITAQAFTVPQHRNWISKPECEQVKNLLANSNLKNLPDRVARAHWNVQHAAYQYFFEVRTLLVISGLEALLHTRQPRTKRARSVKAKRKPPGTGEQFVTRTMQLAKLLNIGFTEKDAKAVWDHRSDVAHGRDPWAARQSGKGSSQPPPQLSKNDETVRRYIQAEQILRMTVLKCLTDRTFAAIFTSDDAVAKAFPI